MTTANRLFLSLLFVGFSFWIGYYHLCSTTQYFNSATAFEPGDTANARSPAAIRRDLDFSALSDMELSSAAQNRLISAAQVVRSQDGRIGLALGHFATRDAKGRKVLACDYYRRIRLNFTAEGISEGGEKPTIKVTALCEPESDLAHMKPVFIPVAEIWNQSPTNGEMRDPSGIHLAFENIPSEWPSRWILDGIRLDQGDQSAKGAEALVIDESTIRHWRKKSGVLDFTVRSPASK